jgi:hypothetical protein
VKEGNKIGKTKKKAQRNEKETNPKKDNMNKRSKRKKERKKAKRKEGNNLMISKFLLYIGRISHSANTKLVYIS